MSRKSSITVSVVVPTRNRAEHAAACARELLQCATAQEILFIDQSDDDSTEFGLRALGDPRIRCVRSALRGATNGRNVGIDLSTGAVIAFTDDDCRVSRDWVERIADVFQSDPDVAIVCGRVWVPEEIEKQGYAAAFEPEQRNWRNEFPPPGRDWGLTANFAVRRSAFEKVGKFDPFLGVGAPFQGGEEPDLIFRMLRAGFKVINAREVEVKHLGIRQFGTEASRLSDAYAVGTAAALAKHIRLGELEAAKIYFANLRQMTTRVATNLLSGERPLGLRYLASFVSGTLRSFRFGVSTRDRLYENRA